MMESRGDEEIDYEVLRGEPIPSIDNLIRWEKIKLRGAARDAIRLLEAGATPTREYLDYMFNMDVGMKELRARIAKHRERLRELESMRADAALVIDPVTPSPG